MNEPTADINGGWLAGALRHPSPNHDARPDPGDISLLVIHNISLPPHVFGGPWIDNLFLNRLDAEAHPYFENVEGLRVSSHLLIRRSGQMVQYVPFHRRAWHAGESSYDGRDACNDFSIGIEMEGDDETPFTESQYLALIDVTKCLMEYFPRVTPNRIAGHSDIAPHRKTDPGPAFEWEKFREALADRS